MHIQELTPKYIEQYKHIYVPWHSFTPSAASIQKGSVFFIFYW